MKNLRKYADFTAFFTDAEYVSERLANFWSRMSPGANGCVEFDGCVDAKGYRRFTFGNAHWPAHRILWMIANGDPGDRVIDHLCRNRGCVNLEHLELVTNAENVRRGKMSKHGGLCPNGHKMTKCTRGWLECPQCKNEKARHRFASDPEYRHANYERTKRLRAAAKLASAA